MTLNIETAIRNVEIGVSDKVSPEDYRLACEYLSTHREQLSHMIFIDLPGGLSGNSDHQWEIVKKNSETRCNCGNERVIIPANMRTEYQESSERLIISPEKKLYLGLNGGPKSSAYIKLWTDDDCMGFLYNPFRPNAMNALFPMGVKLQAIYDMLQTSPTKFTVHTAQGNIPIVRANKVDLSTKVITFTPDKYVVEFSEEMPDDHECKKPTYTIISMEIPEKRNLQN